jgi:hypothetical protein
MPTLLQVGNNFIRGNKMEIPRINPEALGKGTMEVGTSRNPQEIFRAHAEMQQNFYDIPTELIHCGLTIAVVNKTDDDVHKQLAIMVCGTIEDQQKMLALLIRHCEEAIKQRSN